VHTLLV